MSENNKKYPLLQQWYENESKTLGWAPIIPGTEEECYKKYKNWVIMMLKNKFMNKKIAKEKIKKAIKYYSVVDNLEWLDKVEVNNEE